MNKRINRTNPKKIAGSIMLTAILTAAALSTHLAPLSAREQNQTGGAARQRQVPLPTPAGSHLHLVLRIQEDGTAEVIQATELPGQPILANAMTGDFIYEVADDQETLAVETTIDPFETRSFPGSDSPNQGHHFKREQTATLIVKAPNMTLASANLDQLAVRLYKIKSDTHLERIDPSVFRKMRDNDQLEKRFEMTDRQLGPEIRQKGRKLGIQ